MHCVSTVVSGKLYTFIYQKTLLKSLHTAQRPGIVRNLTSGPVSVNKDSMKVQLLQSISWQPPVSGEIVLYLIRYGMGVHNPEDASFNITSPNTSVVLTLSVEELDEDMLVYNIWVTVLTETQEKGNATVLTIIYTSE